MLLLRVERSGAEQFSARYECIERRSDLVTHGCEKLGFSLTEFNGGVAGPNDQILVPLAACDVARHPEQAVDICVANWDYVDQDGTAVS